MDEILRRFTPEQISEAMELFRRKVMVKDRRVGLKVHRSCFIGQEAVTVLCSEYGLRRPEAALLGQVFQSRGLFHAVGRDPDMYLRDGIHFYRFAGSKGSADQEKSGRHLRHAFGALRRHTRHDPSRQFPDTTSSPMTPLTPLSPLSSDGGRSWHDPASPQPTTPPADPHRRTSLPPAASVLDPFFAMSRPQQAAAIVAVAVPVQWVLSILPVFLQMAALAAMIGLALAYRGAAPEAAPARPVQRALPSPSTPASPLMTKPRSGAAWILPKARKSSEIQLAHQSRDFLQLAHLSEQLASNLTEALSNATSLSDQPFRELLHIDEDTPPSDCRLLESLAESDLSFLLSDPNLPGNPIIYASPRFRAFTGFSPEEIRALNQTQQLHGPETSRDTLLAVQQAILDRVPISARLRLYKKDRTPFWSQFYIQPLNGVDGKLDKWLAIISVTEGPEAPDLLLLPRSKLQAPEVPTRSRELDSMVQRLRGQLRKEFPAADLDYFDEDFLAAVAGKPGRTFEYCIEKLRGSVEWRQQVGVDTLTEAQVAPMLMSTEMFWHRYDVYGRPILYLRPGKQDMRTFDRPMTFKAIVYTMEQGLKLMPPGVVTCILVIDAQDVGWSHFDTQLTKQVLSMASVGYRDRVDRIVVGPSGIIVASAWKFVKPLMSENLRKKIHITNNPVADLSEFVDPKDIPHHVFKS